MVEDIIIIMDIIILGIIIVVVIIIDRHLLVVGRKRKPKNIAKYATGGTKPVEGIIL